MKIYIRILIIVTMALVAILPQFAETVQEVFTININIDLSINITIMLSIYAILKK